MTVALLLAAALAVAAPGPESCPAGPPALPPAMAGWAARTPIEAVGSPAGLDRATLALGRGVDAALRPAEAVTYAAPPGKPAGPGAKAGLLALQVAAPGTYAVGLSSAAWIDVVDAQGAPVASAGHDHGPPCSGMRKVVDFPLEPGRYVVQLTTGGEPAVGVLAFRR